MNQALLQCVTSKLSTCNDWQLSLLNSLLDSLTNEVICERNSESDIVTADFALAFGEVLKLHHCLSSQYLDKDRFEATIERILRQSGAKVSRPANRCNPGHDITVNDEKWSLKTQGDLAIKRDVIHISKFMELGKGQWKDKVEDLYALRDRFIHHTENYSRIFQLRYFRPITNSFHFYELVEIPKQLLDEARTGTFEIFLRSKQDPKPGVCRVIDQEGVQKFELYFDGGSERKLQIRGLRRDLCTSHATWSFKEMETLSSVTDAEPFGSIPV